MAIWAKNLKVLHVIIMAISVFMMNTKNSRLGIVTTPIALINQSTRDHSLSYGSKIWFKRFFRLFSNAFFRTKFTIFTWRIHKFFMTMIAFKFFGSSPFQGFTFVITFTRTILSFIYSAGNMLKLFFTYSTISFNLNSFIKSFTCITAKFSRILSIISNFKFNFTISTCYFYSLSRSFFSRRIHNAT